MKETHAMTLDAVRELLASGKFHHATYRNFHTLWEGLYVYVKDDSAVGFNVAGVFPKNDPDLDQAHAMLAHTGISVGARGRG